MVVFFKKLSLFLITLITLQVSKAASVQDKGAQTISLNGEWQMGFSRKYTATVKVPSIAADPAQISNEVLWYKKEIKLPPGNWVNATLELKGARFRPQVYINGNLDGEQPGGMAPVFFLLHNSSVKPGNTITLEVALASLKNTPQSDASYIPGSDQWRSNVSSGLWDDVVLHLHGEASISRIIPFVDYKNQKVSIQYDLNTTENFQGKVDMQIVNGQGKVLVFKTQPTSGLHGQLNFDIKGSLKSWSPANPNLYHLKLAVFNNNGLLSDQSAIPFGVKTYQVLNKKFYLNDKPFVAKGVTVVWHRWVRSKAGRELGYDTAWFKQNIIKRSKDMGANYLRFHLGKPPERFLDLCDKYGLIVQYEWSFFHGMPASKESLLEQYKNWLDVAMRHPSVSMIHPYNETGGEQLKTVWEALDILLKDYPPLVLEDRDVIHIHKYWWSIFENVGLYYDTADVFPKTIIADEFGGNYLDEKGDLGGYPALKESFLRFLGRKNSMEDRLLFQAQSNARIAEYWRRIGAAGFSPFCSLSSDEDGNTWFLGQLKDGKPKPVWKALTASFSPQSVSVGLWDKNFEPAQKLQVPVYLFNDEAKKANLSVSLTIEDKTGKVLFKNAFSADVNPFSKKVVPIWVNMPTKEDDYAIKAELLNKPVTVKYPVISEWGFRIFNSKVPENIKNISVAVLEDETELLKFLNERHIKTVGLNDTTASVLLTSLKTWGRLAAGDKNLSDTFKNAVNRGKSIVMLDVGDRGLGQGYPKKAGDLGPLQGVATLNNPKLNQYELFGGIILKFTEAAEPESYIHPDKLSRELWDGLPDQYTRIWNGLRGGLIVPAADMEFSGLSSKAFVGQWKSRGAEEQKIISGPYYAYELQGFYVFSEQAKDIDAQKKLKAKVQFLVQDAPALASSINPLSPILITDLSKGYHDAGKGIAYNYIPMANAGKNLTKTPVALVDFGSGKGKLIVSQLLTAGRLCKGFGESGFYGIRYDEVANQFVLNMISTVIKK